MKPPRRKAAPSEALLTNAASSRQSGTYENTGGRSQENHRHGFRPAFVDTSTGSIYESRFVDGRLAPVHLLDGLPDEVVAERDAGGQVVAAKGSVVAGFVRHGYFFSREEAARVVSAGLRTSPSPRACAKAGARSANVAVARMGRAA